MSNRKHRIMRVPKKVTKRAGEALELQRERGVDLESAQAVFIAQALNSTLPVDGEIPAAMAQFFTGDWRYDPKRAWQSGLYGGDPGREWAKRCMAVLTAAEPEVKVEEDDDYTVDELFEFTDEETSAILAFLTGLSEVVPEANEVLEKIAEPTQEMLESEISPEDELGETSSEDAELEARMVQDALGELGLADLPDLDLQIDFAAQAEEARERMAAAALTRERNLAMAKMASARMTLQAEGPIGEAVAEKVAAAPADADPKAPGSEHHASRQVRDWHGRFAKVGARVRSQDGNLGYIKKVDDQGQLVIEDDEGNRHTVSPDQIEVISKKSPARLSEPQALVEDPNARLDTYLQWAQDQMGVGGAQ